MVSSVIWEWKDLKSKSKLKASQAWGNILGWQKCHNWVVVTVAELCKFTKNYSTVLLKGVNFMICNLYHNKSCFKTSFPGDFDVHLIWGTPAVKCFSYSFLFWIPSSFLKWICIYPSLRKVIIKSRTHSENQKCHKHLYRVSTTLHI